MKKIFLYSLPILYLLGSMSHFIYDFLNQNYIIGFISPINESIYEHTKLAIIPLLVFYIYLYFKDKNNINKVLKSFICSLVITSIMMPLLYYFVSTGFDINSLIIDIFIFFISITIGQLIALHIYEKSSKPLNIKISILIILIYFIITIFFTLKPPAFPIFIE